jgi:diguanylate cyclase (GGDEF)-like protein
MFNTDVDDREWPAASAAEAAAAFPVHSSAIQALSRINHPVWIYDFDAQRVLWANGPGLSLWRAKSLAALCERRLGVGMSPAVDERLRQFHRDLESTPERSITELWTLYPQGVPTTQPIEFSAFVLDDGRIAALCQAQTPPAIDLLALRSAEALLHTPLQVTLYSEDGEPLYRNPAARAAAPRPEQRLDEHLPLPEDLHELLQGLRDRGEHRLLAQVHTAAGRRWHELTARRCLDAATGQTSWLVSESDVSATQQVRREAEQLAERDALTHLHNRHHVSARFPGLLSDLSLAGRPAALIHLNLDRFKLINESHGHGKGDRVLVEVARRLRGALRASDQVVRLGGDEFLILVCDDDVVAHARRLGLRLRETLGQRHEVDGAALRVTASLGVSLFPADGADLSTLMSHAELAMHRAKGRGGDTLVFYSAELGQEARRRGRLEGELMQALENGEFVLHYQPRVEALTQRIVGAEALVRWHHPDRGLVMPSEFIPVCEDSGLILQLGSWVLEQAARQAARWHARGHDLRISVNFSARQIQAPDLVEHVDQVLARSGCPPAALEMEITESLLAGEDLRMREQLDTLSRRGLRIAIDDFGTGYSNLAYLERFPLDCLKIDRRFVEQLDTRPAIAKVIISMCQVLDLEIVAEGVETPAQLAWLQAEGCHQYQGFLRSQALPPEAFESLLQTA